VGWFWGFLFIVMSGPILAYGRQTAGEMLAMGLLVWLVAATVLRAPPAVVALAAAGACITKETSYPFVAALGLLGLVLARRRTGKPILKHTLWGIAGMAVAITAASLFNVVRFGSVLNTNYLEEPLRTPTIGRTLDYIAAVFVSPSGGVYISWPAASVLVTVACVLPLLKADYRSAYARPALVVIGVVGALSIGFASWWTPFGWSGYGPRLQMPWAPPLVLIVLVAYGEELTALARRLVASTWRLLAVFAVVLVSALPHIGYMWDFESLSGYFQQEHPECNAPWRSGVQTWHRCQHRLLWDDRPMPFYTVDGVKTVGGATTAALVALGLLGSLLLLRDALSREVRTLRQDRRERTPARPAVQTAGPRTGPAR
jgi:hypothetical protein